VRVFIVWEPILPTDFVAPTTSVLGRAPDPRVQQYWDPNHVLAKQMAADVRPPQPRQECCLRAGNLWDLVAVYPKGMQWDVRMPIATMFDGPVVNVIEAMSAAIGASGR
jgi:hypothetical protein